jgi:hypothetical protein
VEEAFTPDNLQKTFGGRLPILEAATTNLMADRSGDPEVHP